MARFLSSVPMSRISVVLRPDLGDFEFSLNGSTKVYHPGDVVLIPSNSPHAGKALTACKLMDVFSPVREEYK